MFTNMMDKCGNIPPTITNLSNNNKCIDESMANNEAVNQSDWNTVITYLKHAANNYGKNKRRRNDDPESPTQPDLSNNPFAILSEIESSSSALPDSKKPKKGAKRGVADSLNNNLSNADQQTTQDSANRIVSKKSFCPPIYIFGANCSLINDVLSLAASECQVTNLRHEFVNLGYRKTKVYVDHASVHKLIIEKIRGTGIGAFSFSPKETKRVSILLKGVDGDTPVEAIKHALSEAAPNIKISKISPFTTLKTKDSGLKLNIFIV